MHPQGNRPDQDLDAAPVILRSFDPERDQAFIYSSWRNSGFYHSAQRPSAAQAPDYFKDQTAKIKRILSRARVRVACLGSDPNVIVGYVVYTGTHLDWIYVKHDFRAQGIGRLLTPTTIETFTDHLTKIGLVLVHKKNLKLRRSEDASREESRTKDPETPTPPGAP